MGLDKKMCVVFGILVVLGFLFVIRGNISGDIVRNVVDVGNCSDVLIDRLWDAVFIESSAGINVFKENVVGGIDCAEYIAYKNDSDGGLWVLYEGFYDNSWVGVAQRYSSGKKMLNETVLLAVFLNVSDSFLNNFGSLDNVVDVVAAIEGVGVGDMADWSVQSVSAARIEFDNVFSVDVSGSSFDDNGGEFGFDEAEVGDWVEFVYSVRVLKDDVFVGIEDYSIVNYDPSFVVDFVVDVPNFEFDKNSSWNVAFNVSNHFNISEEVLVDFYLVGADNIDGELINYSIVGDVVSFMPALNFTGYKEFQLVATNPDSAGSDVFSNTFNVSIEIANDAPVLMRDIESIGVPRDGGTNVYLDVYFDDPDGDNMTYRVAGDVVGLDIDISDEVMGLRLKDEFNTSKIWVYADDGKEETKSNKFWVFDAGNYSAAALVASLDDNESGDDLNGSVTTSGVDGNESGNSVGVSGDDDGSNWVLLGIIVAVALVLIILIIWFFILKNGRPSGPSSLVGTPTQSLVNNYLRNLNFLKG